MNGDKKKNLIVGALAAVLIGVGAFQFVPKGGPTGKAIAKATPPKASGAAKAGGDQAKPGTDPALDGPMPEPLPKRDPFAQLTPMDSPEGAAQTAPVAANTAQTKPAPERPKTSFAGGGPGWEPPVLEGPGPLKGGSKIGNLETTKAPPLRQAGEFAYKVVGILNGAKPMAVFEDDHGTQCTVPLGGNVDPHSRVIGIERGQVRIRHNGKEQTLHLSEGQ